MLTGIVVADFSRILAGPLCTQMLGDFGARVIKVEEPSAGDETRRWGPPFVNGVSTYFLSLNRHKESVALDLTSDGGRSAARALIGIADVVVDNFLPAQRQRLGLDDIASINPRAIHCSISGYEPSSPDAARPGYDLLAQAGAGLMSITGDPSGDPMKIGVALSDVLTAHYAASAICAALFARQSTGTGARIEVSLFGATVASLVNVAQAALATGAEAVRHGNAHPSIVPYQLFRAGDRPFVVGCGTDRHFAALCTVIERSDLAGEPRFETNSARVEHRAELLPILEELFAKRAAAEWIEALTAAGVPCSPINGVLEALRSPNGEPLVTRLDHPVAGTYDALRHPVRIDGAQLPAGTAPPLLGADTERVLAELQRSTTQAK